MFFSVDCQYIVIGEYVITVELDKATFGTLGSTIIAYFFKNSNNLGDPFQHFTIIHSGILKPKGINDYPCEFKRIRKRQAYIWSGFINSLKGVQYI
ncbi:hypothetical protein HZS_7032 [Henneguya salminicola]|nr:hypothetical protein HZS_7032 [Henneguya salminicola]